MRPRALPWARGGLRRLRRHGVRLGLVTASTRGVVEPNLARLNLADAFEVMVFADDVEHGKPHPEGLLRALDAMALAAGRDRVRRGHRRRPRDGPRGRRAVRRGRARRRAGETFRAAGVARVWPGVGAWADALLGPA